MNNILVSFIPVLVIQLLSSFGKQLTTAADVLTPKLNSTDSTNSSISHVGLGANNTGLFCSMDDGFSNRSHSKIDAGLSNIRSHIEQGITSDKFSLCTE